MVSAEIQVHKYPGQHHKEIICWHHVSDLKKVCVAIKFQSLVFLCIGNHVLGLGIE